MGQRIKQKSGAIKVSLHAAVEEETYDRLKAAAERSKSSMGEVLDRVVTQDVTTLGFVKKFGGGN